MKTEITRLRKELGFSQQRLADEVEVTRQTINALEKGRYNPSLLLAYKITKALKCKYIEEVFKMEEDE